MNMPKISLFSLASILSLLLCVSCSNTLTTSAKAQLKLNLQKGQSYVMHIKSDQSGTQEVQKQTSATANSLDAVLRYEVMEVSESGYATLSTQYQSVHTKNEGQGANRSFEYDSQNPPSDPQADARMWDALLKNSYTITLSSRGAVEEVTGMEAIRNQALEGLAPAFRQLFRPTFESVFGDQAIKEQMNSYLLVFPEKPVKIGDSWKSENTFSKGVPVISESTFTLTGRSQGVVTIRVHKTFSHNPKAGVREIGPFTITYTSMTGTQESIIEVDEKTGWIIKNESSQKLSGEMDMEVAAVGYHASAAPFTLESAFLFELVQPPIED